MTVPYSAIADEEVATGVPLQGVTWRKFVSDGLHHRSTRGRLIDCGHVHRPLQSGIGALVVKIPVQATPHELLYDVKLRLGVTELVADWEVLCAVSSADAVGGGHASAAQVPARILIGDDRLATLTEWPGARLRYPFTAVDPQQWAATPTSGWVTHETDPALAKNRILTLTFSAPSGWAPGGTALYLLGICLVGYELPEVL